MLLLYCLVFLVMESCCFESHNSTNLIKGCENLNEITLVSAYFEVSAVPFYFGISRNQKAYLSYFSRVARLKNDLIVFCQSYSVKDEILKIRRKFGLENRTNVAVISNVFSIDANLFDKMTNISVETSFLKFRKNDFIKKPRSNEPTYDYVVNLKAYFLNRANNEFDIRTRNVAWIDFGLDHGGDYYSHEEDWGFNLQCELADNLVTLFYVRDSKPFFEVVRTFYAVIGSGFFMMPRKLINDFYLAYNKSLYTLLEFGLMDDDQAVLLLATHLYPGLFELKRSWYCLAVKQYCNGDHMRLFPESLNYWWMTDGDRDYLRSMFNISSSLSSSFSLSPSSVKPEQKKKTEKKGEGKEKKGKKKKRKKETLPLV